MQIVAVNQERPVQPMALPPSILTYAHFSNPARTEVSDGHGWLATFTNGAKTVALRGATRSFIEHAAASADDFTRVVSGSWGSSPSGGKWYTSGGADSDYSVTGSLGKVEVTTANVSRRLSMSNILQNVTVTAKVATDKTAYGDNQSPGVLLGWQDFENHYIARLDFKPSQVVDSFSRQAAAGWGSANSDQTWDTSGAATDYTVNGTTGGQHSVGSINVSRRTFTANAVDFDVRVRVATPVLAAGASQAAGILGRYQDSNNHYIFRARFSPSSGNPIFAAIQKQESGTITTLGSEVQVNGVSHAANAFYWLRATATGTTLRFKLWADGSAEPIAWDIQLADSSFTGAGAVGVRSLLLPGNNNALPVVFSYDDFEATLEGARSDTVRLSIQKRVGGVTTTISPIVTLPGVTHESGDWFNIRASMINGVVGMRAWKNGDGEPPGWQTHIADTTFTSGRVGLRAYLEQDALNTPVTFYYDDFAVEGQWPVAPTVTHKTWVRLLDQPFDGAVPEDWLRSQLNNTTPDVLATAMQYINDAPPINDVSRGNLQTAGKAQYGPLQTDGTRQEGADFNDYLGISWQYGATTDNPEVSQFKCLDCSGYVRMVFGYRHGLPLALTTTNGLAIPRVSSNIANSGPGVVVATGSPPSLNTLLPGDIVCFDADTSNPAEEEGQIDHNGIYLGADTNGHMRFLSSRKTISGPTMADLGGPSFLDGSGLYARSLRLVRRF